MKQVDLNCDLGESFGNYHLGMDEEVLPFITSANVACGFHASDPSVMSKTVAMAKKSTVCVGAHPGFPDLMGFGRRPMQVTPEEAKVYVQYQVGALSAFCKAAKVPLCHVKPHGALYNMAGKDYALAKAICEGIAEIDENLILLALSGSEMVKAAAAAGLRVASEVFADRAYEEDGSLVSRAKPGSIITDDDEAIRRAVGMVRDGEVLSITGKKVPIQADSICVHGDNPKALAFVSKIHAALVAEGIQLSSLSELSL